MNNLSHDEKCAVLRCLVEGNSIRATVRITGTAKNTVARLLREAGQACLEYQDNVDCIVEMLPLPQAKKRGPYKNRAKVSET